MARVVTHAYPRDPGSALATAGIFTAGLVGIALAVQIPLGLALLIAVLYLPLLFLNFPLAVCLWIPVVFLEAMPTFNLASKAAGLLLVVGWAGALLTGTASRGVFARHRRLLEGFGLLVVWLTISIVWAPHTGQAAGAAWQWWAIVLVFLIVATSITSEQMLVLAAGMYVVGALLAALAAGGLTGGGARLAGAIGDPNFLAAALTSAVPLAFAMFAVRTGFGWRWLCIGSVAVLAAGIVATQSRGGLISAVAMWLAAIIVLPRRRQVLALGALTAIVVAAALAVNPLAWERVTNVNPGEATRTHIWTVAWAIFEDHPVQGVGLNSFARVAPDYVREIGPLEDVDTVVDTPARQVHNSYLQLLAENGIFALALFLVVVFGCLRAALQAARLFADLERPELAAVAHAIWVGSMGLLASYVFLSGSIDRRLWILLGLSLAALEVARRMTAEASSLRMHDRRSRPEPFGAEARSARP